MPMLAPVESPPPEAAAEVEAVAPDPDVADPDVSEVDTPVALEPEPEVDVAFSSILL